MASLPGLQDITISGRIVHTKRKIMKKLAITSILAIGLCGPLTGCYSTGHPSTDTHHSHVDTSSTRYDEYDPNYAYHDQTQPRKARRVYEDFNNDEDNNDDDDDNGYYDNDGRWHEGRSNNGGNYTVYRGNRYHND